jgi:putative transposase
VLLHRGHRYRIYPTPAQVERLTGWHDALRFLWNVAHEQRVLATLARCRVDRRYLTAFDQGAELKHLRAELPWLADAPSDLCMSVLDDLHKSWQRFWDGTGGKPRFKSKKRGDVTSLKEFGGTRFRVLGEGRDGVLIYPKIGEIRATVHRPLVGKQKSCSLTREGDAWYASILCELEVEDPAPALGPPLAIDVGIAHLLADSDRRLVANPRAGDALAKRVARAQRVVARRERGSKNQAKAKRRVAVLQRKARRQRDHVLHVESKKIAREQHCAVILEELDVQNMMRSARGTVEEPGRNVAQKAGLNRSIADAGWARFGELLKYKLAERGSRIVRVKPEFSSQTCASCGHVDAASRATRDQFACVACGHKDHADLNAAAVLLERGKVKLSAELADTACGGVAAMQPVKQERRAAKRATRKRGAS